MLVYLMLESRTLIDDDDDDDVGESGFNVFVSHSSSRDVSKSGISAT